MAIELTPKIVEIVNALFNNPGLNMADLDRAPPTIATVRELELDGGPTSIEARYSGANYVVDLSSLGLEKALMLLHSGELNTTEHGPPKGEYKTPLSLHNKTYSYVIIKLKSKNWQFSGAGHPFSIETSQWDKGTYYEARKVYQGVKQPKGSTQNGCMIAYFIADGAKARLNAPNGEYSHGFNFHLDFIYQDSNHQPSYMPIIIDPDIRYPGGSGGQ